MPDGDSREGIGPPVLEMDGFRGPMDVLLDLAERQRIDLGRVSLVDLVEQFVAALAALSGRVPVERQADWVVLATRLVLLRSRLLTATPEEAADAERDAAAELHRLDEVGRMRTAARWLEARPVLGRDVFARPRGRSIRTETYMALMEACLVVLRGRAGRPEAAGVHSIVVPAFWAVSDAMARIRALLAARPEGGELHEFLPEMTWGGIDGGLRRRAAVASTLVAGLELARNEDLALHQQHVFADVIVSPRPISDPRL